MPKRNSKEDFLKSLYNNNEHYKNGFFIVTGEYINSRSNIEIETKYGKCISSIKCLMKNRRPTILSAIDKTDYFKKSLIDSNIYYKENFFEVIGQYESVHTPILLKDKYGICKICPAELLEGAKTSILSAIDKTEYFKNIVSEKNKNYSNGDFEIIGEYINNNTPIKILTKDCILNLTPNNIITYKGLRHRSSSLDNVDSFYIEKIKKNNKCYRDGLFEIIGQIQYNKKVKLSTKYGICYMTVDNLVAGKCPDIRSAEDKNLYAINMLKTVHGDLFEYDKLVYRTNASNILIKCDKHGYFEQSFSNHMSGKGCKQCQIESGSFGKDNWCNKISKNRNGKLYVLKFSNKEEIFLKIGITLRDVKSRYNYRNIPYNIETLYLLDTNEREFVWNLEKIIKNRFKPFSYDPLYPFQGSKTEVFNYDQKNHIIDFIKEEESKLLNKK